MGRRRGRCQDFDMAEIDRLVPVVKLDPARLHRSAPALCGCCDLEKKKRREIQIPAWMFRSDDDGELAAVTEEEEEEEEHESQQRSRKQVFAEYMIDSNPLTNEETARHIDGFEVSDRLNHGRSPGQQCYSPVFILPHSSHKDGFFGLDWHSEYRMHEMTPTHLGNARFSEPSRFEYDATQMLQICSVRLVEYLSHDRPHALVYGFIAARDDLDALPNFLFNRTPEDAQEVVLSHPILDLSSPLRGISAFEHVLIEFNLKLKKGCCSRDDEVLIDGCIEFTDRTISFNCDRKLRSRIVGSVGSVGMDYFFPRHGVEATIEISFTDTCLKYYLPKIRSYIVMNGDTQGICIHEIGRHELRRMHVQNLLTSSSMSRSSSVLSVTFVIAVPLNDELEIRCNLMQRPQDIEVPFHFKVQKLGSFLQSSEKYAELLPSGVKVTWSTLGFHTVSPMDYQRLLR